MTTKKKKLKLRDICPLYTFCPSPSRSADWICLKNGAVRAKSCMIYIGFMRVNDSILQWINQEVAKRKTVNAMCQTV